MGETVWIEPTDTAVTIYGQRLQFPTLKSARFTANMRRQRQVLELPGEVVKTGERQGQMPSGTRQPGCAGATESCGRATCGTRA